jgi:transcriptional regulator with XRE-family HTH domain
VGHKARYRPARLAAKLLQIRRDLGLSQSQLAKLLDLQIKTSTARVSEYESGAREPGLLLLLRYARIVGISVEVLIDDSLNLPERITPKRWRKSADIRHTETI